MSPIDVTCTHLRHGLQHKGRWYGKAPSKKGMSPCPCCVRGRSDVHLNTDIHTETEREREKERERERERKNERDTHTDIHVEDKYMH